MRLGDERPATVCVTGALGFIGRHLCRALAERGHPVVAVDRRANRSGSATGFDDHSPTGGPPLPAGVRLVRADLSVDPIAPLLEGVDAVAHLAALPGARARHSVAELWRHNVRATERIAAALGARRRLVLASTSSVYGAAPRLPTPEHSPTAPLNAYAVTKLAAERAVLAAARQGADAFACRLFTVYGPGQRPDMAFARWIDAVVSGRAVPWCAAPGARREFTYVGDAVRGLVAALDHGRRGWVYNVAGSGSTPLRAALAEIEAILGRPARIVRRPRFPEAVATAACGERARAELGYEPAVSLRDGLERQVEAAAARARDARLVAA